MACVCVREEEYKHAQCFRVDVYKSSFLKHKILSLKHFRVSWKWVAICCRHGWRLSFLKVTRNGILSEGRQVRLETSYIWAGKVMHGVSARLKHVTDVTGSL